MDIPAMRPAGLITLRFGDNAIDIYPDSTLIRTSDGAVPAVPHDTASYLHTARSLGYGDDTLTMCKEHEVLHVALSHWLGVESPVIAALTSGDDGLSDDAAHTKLRGLEERAVMAIQRLCRAMGIDLIEQLNRSAAASPNPS